MVRLEPFREAQIRQWLRVWNHANAASLTARGLRPLAPETALEHADLASQPLLLIMLALYDADGNPLQRAAAALKEAELYERLLVSFAEREIRKSSTDLTDRQFQAAVDRELLRLAVVAFGMFSRSRQWISDVELDADLPALLGAPGSRTAPPGLQAPLSAAQMVVGRFFFVHEAQATRDDTRLHTYEFLHATFGEYLIARLVTRELEDLADAAQFAADRNRPEPAADAFLRALLSYMPLTMRGTVVSFAAERIQALPEPRRLQLRTVLLELFGDALGPRHDSRYEDYIPQPITVPAQSAAYSVNLALLAVLATGEVTGASLFPTARDPVAEWRKLTLLWRSQLPFEGWAGLIYSVALDRIWLNDQRDVVLRYSEGAGQRSGSTDLHWSYNRAPNDEYRQVGRAFGWRPNSDDWLRDQAWFLCHQDDDTAALALEPFAGDFNGLICSFHNYWPDEGRAVSTVNALITLWLVAGSDCTADELAGAYDTCLEIAIRARFDPAMREITERFRNLVLRQLAADKLRLPKDWLDLVIARIREAANEVSVQEPAELLHIANKVFPELMAASLHSAAQPPDTSQYQHPSS